MPELAEVETIVRGLRPELIGKRIVSADVFWSRTLAIPTAAKFKLQVKGQKITGVGRRAKYLIIKLENYNLLIHLRMSGDLVIRKGKIKAEKHDRLILTLSSPSTKDRSYLAFNDTRKFGRVWLTDQPERILNNWDPSHLKKNSLRNGYTTTCMFVNVSLNHYCSINPSLPGLAISIRMKV